MKIHSNFQKGTPKRITYYSKFHSNYNLDLLEKILKGDGDASTLLSN